MTFDDAFERFYETVLRYCVYILNDDRVAAEEATSKTFIVLFLKWDTLTSYDDQFLRCWLIGVARNAIKEVKRERRRNPVPTSDAALEELLKRKQLETVVEYDSAREQQKYEQYLILLKEKLKPIDFDTFYLLAIKRTSHAEAAKRLHITENALYIRWSRLRKKLKIILKQIEL